MPDTARKCSPIKASGSIRADEILMLPELRRRFGWGPHVVRQARQAGLRFVSFGRQKFVLGSDLIDFFRRLGAEQDGTAHTMEGRP